MRISDWSSDVCSSDLFNLRRERLALSGCREVDEMHGKIQIMRYQYVERCWPATYCLLIAGADFGRYAFHPRSEEHTSELQSLMRISYAVFCLKKKKKQLS